MIPGIDVSQWQHDIDWREVKRSGVKFAFVKATEFADKQTTLLEDNKYQENVDGAQANGIHWSAVHYFRSHIDPVLQARVFCETSGEFNSLPPVLELKSAAARGERLNYKVRQFLEEVEKITARRPVICTSEGFWRGSMAFEKSAHTDWAVEYPLWMTQLTTLWPNPVYPWPVWDFWQYSDKGRIPGILTSVNLNWFAGSEAELVEKFIQRDNERYPVYVFEDEEYGRIPVVISKAPPASQPLDEQYKGDYQESSEKQAAPEGFTPITQPSEPKYSSSQENWIKEYFF
jgi:lysozyme